MQGSLLYLSLPKTEKRRGQGGFKEVVSLAVRLTSKSHELASLLIRVRAIWVF